jgi:hypothetical protein
LGLNAFIRSIAPDNAFIRRGRLIRPDGIGLGLGGILGPRALISAEAEKQDQSHYRDTDGRKASNPNNTLFFHIHTVLKPVIDGRYAVFCLLRRMRVHRGLFPKIRF